LAPSSSTEDDGEDSIAAYMERLLARNRSSSTYSEPVESAPSAPVLSPRQQIPQQPPPGETVEPQPEPVVPRKSRKIDEEQKQSIRSNLHSFREVANQSARTAVAKSRRTQKSSSLRNMVILNIAGWISALVMLIAEQWLIFSLRTEAFCVALVSLFLTAICLYRYKEIRKLAWRTPGGHDKTNSTPPGATENPDAAGKSGPLSFL